MKVAVLNEILSLTGSQCRDFSTGATCVNAFCRHCNLLRLPLNKPCYGDVEFATDKYICH